MNSEMKSKTQTEMNLFVNSLEVATVLNADEDRVWMLCADGYLPEPEFFSNGYPYWRLSSITDAAETIALRKNRYRVLRTVSGIAESRAMSAE